MGSEPRSTRLQMWACLFGGWMVPVNPSSCCSSSGLLLLMIGVIATLLPQLWARPTDFWCNCQARKSMERRIEGMQTDVVRNRNGKKKIPWARSQNVIAVGKTYALPLCGQVHCVGSDTLSSPAQLPCVWVHTAEWANKTVSGDANFADVWKLRVEHCVVFIHLRLLSWSI